MRAPGSVKLDVRVTHRLAVQPQPNVPGHQMKLESVAYLRPSRISGISFGDHARISMGAICPRPLRQYTSQVIRDACLRKRLSLAHDRKNVILRLPNAVHT